jgi:hypothetical protein
MRIDLLKKCKNIDLSPLCFLPELIKVMRGDQTHVVPIQKMTQFLGNMAHLAPFGKWKMDMGAGND